MTTFYAYVYRDENDVPIYVGKGRGKRAYDHLNRMQNLDLLSS